MAMMQPSYSAGVATHGTMFLVFDVLMPLSIGMARYLRRMPKTKPVRWWWAAHAFLNTLAFGLFLVAFTVAVYIAGGGQFADPHKKLGLAILIILIFQFMYGAALSALHAFGKQTVRRDGVIDWIHWSLGYVLLLLGWINVPLGIYKATTPLTVTVSTALQVLYFIWFGFIVLALAVAEGFYQYRGGNEIWALSANDAAERVEADSAKTEKRDA